MENRPSRKFILSFAVVLLASGIGCGREGVRARFAQENRTDFVEPNLLPPITARLRNTHYYTIFEADYAGEKTAVVRDIRGGTLASVTPSFYKDLLMEGSGKLQSGKVVNYHSKISGSPRYEISSNPWGNGVGHCALKPFHTIAVDKRVIPLGSQVYIDETLGMKLPDGTIHDGIWRADDIGSAIQRDRVDLYVGKRGWNTTLSRHGIEHLESLTVRIVKLPDGESCAP